MTVFEFDSWDQVKKLIESLEKELPPKLISSYREWREDPYWDFEEFIEKCQKNNEISDKDALIARACFQMTNLKIHCEFLETTISDCTTLGMTPPGYLRFIDLEMKATRLDKSINDLKMRANNQCR